MRYMIMIAILVLTFVGGCYSSELAQLVRDNAVLSANIELQEKSVTRNIGAGGTGAYVTSNPGGGAARFFGCNSFHADYCPQVKTVNIVQRPVVYVGSGNGSTGRNTYAESNTNVGSDQPEDYGPRIDRLEAQTQVLGKVARKYLNKPKTVKIVLPKDDDKPYKNFDEAIKDLEEDGL